MSANWRPALTKRPSMKFWKSFEELPATRSPPGGIQPEVLRSFYHHTIFNRRGLAGIPGVVSNLEALIRSIRPLELHQVTPQFFCLPGADIPNLSVGVVIPSFARNRIGDRLAKL